MADIDPAPGDSARAITKDAIMITYRQRLALILGQKQRQRSPTFPAVRAAAQYPLRDSGRLSREHLIMTFVFPNTPA